METADASRLPSCEVLGFPVKAVNYTQAVQATCLLAKRNGPAAVTASNTHLLTAARRNPEFARVLNSFDLILPDGMPLVWAMRLKGTRLTDRVYGPYFMREVLLATPAPWKHFFFGGKPETLAALEAAALRLQPDVDIAGSFSPPFGTWSEADETDFAARIRASGADFIWVALGGEKQERWIVKNLARHDRGVFLGVGDAFELLAGKRGFAPPLIQKCGLTWLYRLCQEPRRLWKRYFVNNSLFLAYLLRDLFKKEPRSNG